jgi:general secretion pathway protein N
MKLRKQSLPKKRWKLPWPFGRDPHALAGPPSTMWADSRQMEWGFVGKHNAPLRWSVAGLVLGMLICLIVFAPASWLARSVERSTNGHLLLADTRGSIWSGSAVLVLTGGRGSRDSSALPGRIEWNMGFSGTALALRLRQACCLNGEVAMLLQLGLGSATVTLPATSNAWIARWPASWLGGLGTPWNTLQLGGSVRLSTNNLRVEWAQGRWRQSGQLDLDFVNLSSRVSTLAPLGSYRFSVIGDAAGAGVSRLRLSTQDGALLLSGEGTFGGGKARFIGEASAAPGREDALNNLLNIIGRRQGARSVISIG